MTRQQPIVGRPRRAGIRLGWLAAAAVGYRGIRGTLAVRSSLAWLHAGEQAPTGPAASGPDRPECPVFVLLLPMLREQRLIAETTDTFTELARTWPGTVVALVTTEREQAERERGAQRLPALAAELSRGAPPRRLLRDFAGVLPRGQLDRLAHHTSGKSPDECLAAARAVFDSQPSTAELAAEITAAARARGADVRHHHYPRTDGAMAAQINYAATAELARLAAAGVDPASVFLAVYNADSRPAPATITVAASTIRLVHQSGGTPRVLQQPALFTGNLTALADRPFGGYLTGAALLQSRWTLAHEIPAWRRQARQARALRGASADQRARWPRFAHCTGHGLFIRADEFARQGGLPTATMNEDLAFGYLCSAAGIPIDPLPALECADSPEAPGQLLRQKRQWFWSYCDLPRLVRLAADLGMSTPRGRLLLAAQVAAGGLAWLGTSPAVAATIALPILSRHPGSLLGCAAALAVYYVIPFALIAAEPRRRGQPHPLSGRELAGGLAAYLTHSLGPAWCAANAVHRATTGMRYAHDKTER
jgi:hypothetical protein